MLILAGLGLYDENDITLKALKFAREADVVYAEFYTAVLTGTTIERIEEVIGRRINLLGRKDVEYEGYKIIEEAKTKNVVFLTAGDPMVATTHVDLAVEAKKKGVDVKIINAPSIYSAVGITGLQLYKFGKTTSIVFPEENYFPETPYNVIKENLERGLHTLCLLDIKIEDDKKRFMTANEALEILLKLEERKGFGIISEDTWVVVVARAGSLNPKLVYGQIGNLINYDFGKPLHCVIVPGKLHFMEEEALNVLCEKI
ncbi:diphthine synthase [Methanocaldococcus vulcanius M7]|uniref:Diphthine synthase n=1 Tax=Methanocaldococcus vulcanius (strain ATCC 700851 / DSM 12094 / M7) TaxID=579137 RepID=C9RHT0_METVM|nr:diphthine synthase [Methanocaldococcus vulcanius]ACX73132.1 diphthine synthase [Methanocaldococcus vulcanius M7]